jgi:hypothetical protein
MLLLTAIVLEAVKHGTGWWQFAVFGIGPDLALFYGIGANLEKGQLHRRAVPLYNLVHRYWLPLALATVAAVGRQTRGYFVGALAWAFHISVDRTVGYGLRTRDGFQHA